MRIATLTMNPSIDVHLSAERVVPAKKIRCSEACREPGGGGINVARAIRKLGDRAQAVYPAGGQTGDLLHDLLAAEEVPDRPVPVAGLTRENVTVFERESARQYRFVVPGAALTEAEWRRTLDLVVRLADELDFLVASGSLPAGVPPDFYAKLARAVGPTDVRLCLDTSGPGLAAALEEQVYLIKPNFRELEAVVGFPLDSAEAELEAARAPVDRGSAEIVALSLEERGALFVHKEGHLRVPGVQVACRSTVGAGDSFVAGMVLGLARGLSFEDACRYAVAAGTAAVLTEGSELCRREDVERIFAELGEDGS